MGSNKKNAEALTSARVYKMKLIYLIKITDPFLNIFLPV